MIDLPSGARRLAARYTSYLLLIMRIERGTRGWGGPERTEFEG